MKTIAALLLLVFFISTTGCHKTDNIDAIAGNYLVTSYYGTYTPNGPDSSWVVYPDTLRITRVSNNTISDGSQNYDYNSGQSTASTIVYGTTWYGGASLVTFFKNDPDSILASFHSGINGGSTVSRSGRRMH